MDNLTQITGNYRLMNDISNFKIRIVLKDSENEIESQEFCWEEKKLDNKMLYSYVIDDDFEEEENIRYLSRKKELMENYFPNKKMYIAVDFGEFFEDIYIKKEYILVKINYNSEKGVISIFPDYTIFAPYTLTIDGIEKKTYKYHIENISKKETEKEKIIDLKKVLKNKQKQIHYVEKQISKENNKTYLFLEILRAKNFGNLPIYIKYYINPTIEGSTHCCRPKRIKQSEIAYFGSVHELEIPISDSYIYFEVVSVDTFDRYRTEGIAYFKITDSKQIEKQLKCVKINSDRISSSLRREFIGDYKSYENIEFFGIPENFKENLLNKSNVGTVSTGEIDIRLNAIFPFENHKKNVIKDRFVKKDVNSLKLFRSIEEVTEAFRKARNDMLKARDEIS